MRLLKPLGLILLCASLGGAQTFGIEHYAKVARLTDPHIAPDGLSTLLVVSRPNYKDDRWDSELVRVDLSTRRVQELTHHRNSAHFPRWSPSGDKLAFLADSEGQPQIIVLDKDGGEAYPITHAPTGVSEC